jgi:hypothetical protein
VTVAPALYRRLAALGILSLLLHLLAFESIGRLVRPVDDSPTLPEPMAVRLQAAPAPPPPVPERPAPPVLAATPKVVSAAPPSRAAAQAATPALPSLARPTDAPDTAPEGTDDEGATEAPRRYRVTMPPSATLDYVLTGADGTQVPARIAWQTDGNVYTLAVDGVTGPLASEGEVGDTGVGPRQGTLRDAAGRAVVATFAPDAIVIDGQRHANSIGSQDPASLLLQLVGMGLERPDQMRGTLAVYVATADGPVVMRFHVSEDETLVTPLGQVTTRHLSQIVKKGAPRLEMWLAPEQGWLPLQLRLTAPDGTVRTQTITRIGAASAAP